jgi:hypothetical protein
MSLSESFVQSIVSEIQSMLNEVLVSEGLLREVQSMVNEGLMSEGLLRVWMSEISFFQVIK